MPARSKSQQRLFGMLHAYNKGELECSKSLKAKLSNLSKHISDEDAEHFAKTKHEGLPEKKAAAVTATTTTMATLEEQAYLDGFRKVALVHGISPVVLYKYAQTGTPVKPVAARSTAVGPQSQPTTLTPSRAPVNKKPSTATATVPQLGEDELAARYSKGVDLALPIIKKWEGYRDKAYIDPIKLKDGVSLPTIGYGFTSIPQRDPKTGKLNMHAPWRKVTYNKDPKLNDSLTQEESDQILKHLLRQSASHMYKTLDWSRTLEPRAIAAALSLMHNAGPNILSSSMSKNLARKMKTTPWQNREAVLASEWKTYNRSGGRVIPGLTNRRVAEMKYLHPKSQAEIAALQSRI